MRRGREHLVDFEHSEEIYLVIRDQFPPSPQAKLKVSFMLTFNFVNEM